MPKYLVDLGLDGYNTEEEEKVACDVFLEEQLDFSASSVHAEHLTGVGEGPTVKQLADLWNLCRRFVDKHKPSCPESLQQVDEINLACPDLVEEICECVGYYTQDEEEN